MVLTYILAGVATAATITAEHYRREMKKSDKLASELAQAKLDYTSKRDTSISRLEEALRDEKKSHSETRAQLWRVDKILARGWENLQVRESFGFDDNHGLVTVVGASSDGKDYFIIKPFEYDNRDPDGRDFAIREAEELIETIQKA